MRRLSVKKIPSNPRHDCFPGWTVHIDDFVYIIFNGGPAPGSVVVSATMVATGENEMSACMRQHTLRQAGIRVNRGFPG